MLSGHPQFSAAEHNGASIPVGWDVASHQHHSPAPHTQPPSLRQGHGFLSSTTSVLLVAGAAGEATAAAAMVARRIVGRCMVERLRMGDRCECCEGCVVRDRMSITYSMRLALNSIALAVDEATYIVSQEVIHRALS